MKRLMISLFALALGVGFAFEDAEAKRLGGGRSVGTQRSMDAPRPAAPPAATPAAPANPAAQPQRNRWLAPLAGLAAGLGLAYLFGDHLAPLMGGILLALAIGVGVMLLLRLLSKSRQPALQGAQGEGRPTQYTGLGNDMGARLPPAAGSPDFRSQFKAKIPEGFDVEQFLRQAKKSFIALQAANDAGDVSAVRDLVTDELYRQLEADVIARHGAKQRTEIVTLNADLLEVVTEGGQHWASIRFSGMLREEDSGAPAAFEEIWNLQKPVDGSTGWMLAGIQQVA